MKSNRAKAWAFFLMMPLFFLRLFLGVNLPLPFTVRQFWILVLPLLDYLHTHPIQFLNSVIYVNIHF